MNSLWSNPVDAYLISVTTNADHCSPSCVGRSLSGYRGCCGMVPRHLPQDWGTLPANGIIGGQQHSAESLPKNHLWLEAMAFPKFTPFHGGSLNSVTDPDYSCLILGHLYRTIPTLEISMGLTKASVANASEFNFSLCPVLLPSLFHKCCYWDHSPISPLHIPSSNCF